MTRTMNSAMNNAHGDDAALRQWRAHEPLCVHAEQVERQHQSDQRTDQRPGQPAVNAPEFPVGGGS